MQSKTVSKLTLLKTVLTGLIAISPVLIFYFITQTSFLNGSEMIIENAIILPNQEQSSVGLPVRLKIPVISVDSVVEYVGLTSDGAMDVPKDRANTAWFELGPRPGENGTAVIAGHYGQKNKKGSAFDNLHKLRPGDKIYIEDEKGETISFVVSKTRRYDPIADATDVFGTNTGPSHLNLVTCEGEWDKVSESYPKRLVVFTDRE